MTFDGRPGRAQTEPDDLFSAYAAERNAPLLPVNLDSMVER